MRTLNLQEAAQLMGATCDHNATFSGVSVDSRLHQPENLFFALPGCKTDGHCFLQDVAAKRAVAAVVKNDYKGPDYGLKLLYVKNPLEALQILGKKILLQSKARIVGVTGSVGKTTTKDFITTLLRQKFRVAATPGNSNSQIGVPLAILNHTDGMEDIVVIEMGMTHPGNLKGLIDLAPPECVIITTVALVHACNFDSIEDIARTKAEILCHPRTKLGIINRDIVNFAEIEKIGTCKKISFAYQNPAADYTINSTDRDQLIVKYQEQIFDLGTFPIRGKHHRTNFLAAVACGRYFGLSWEEISSAMPKLVLPELRGQVIEKDGILFINDSYNAAEISIKAALETLPQPQSKGQKVAVLADMLELGKFSENSHREIGKHALDYVDTMFCCGPECRYIEDVWKKANRPVRWFEQREELLNALKRQLKAGDVVLIKGSRGTQLWKLLDEWEALKV